MSTVALSGRLLGTASFSRNGRALTLQPTSATLLAYMLLRPQGEPVSRARLADLIIDDPGSDNTVRRRFNTAVWRLRRALDPDGQSGDRVLATVGSALRIDANCDIWVDAIEFESACQGSRPFDQWTADDAERLAAGVKLYRGSFLDGIYSDWALVERGRLADLHLVATVRLAQWFQRCGDLDRALDHARAAVAAEPLREDLHRLLIHLYAQAGLPQMARTQFERCRAILADELGIDPLPETVAVASVALGEPVDVTPGQNSAYIQNLIQELQRSRAELRRISDRIGRCMQTIQGGDRSVIDEPRW